MAVNREPLDIWQAYEATVFSANVDGEEIRITVGETDFGLDRALEARGVTDWAYVTAWNPASDVLPQIENELRQRLLIGELAHLGFEIAEGQGEPADSSWQPEASVLIFGIDETAAVALGAK